MKKLKVVTADFGIVECDVKRLFTHEDVDFAIVKMPYKYMHKGETYYTNKCVEVRCGGQIPVFDKHKGTLKSYIEASKNVITHLKEGMGSEAFYAQMNEWETLN